VTISLADSRVLIVDDNAFNRKSLAVVVRRAGITEIAFAADGVEGLAMVESFKPDLVLLDVAMPNLDGLEMCRRLRADPAHAELPILFQTALDRDEEQVRCFEAGGSDFISKPIKPGECMARVRHQLERRKLFAELSSFRARVERELNHARAMQLSLLPEPARVTAIGARHGLRIDSHFETSSELGGDLWDVVEIDERRVGFLIVDFAGHGITAAINTFRLHTLAERVPAPRTDPAAWLTQLGLALKEVLPVGQFATAFYGVLDTVEDTLTFAAAGAPHPILGAAEGEAEGEPELLDSSGLLLGVSRKARYENRTAHWPRGGFLFLYSDALVESRDAAGRSIGQLGLAELVRQGRRDDPAHPLRVVLGRFFADMPRPLRDDLTAVWIARL